MACGAPWIQTRRAFHSARLGRVTGANPFRLVSSPRLERDRHLHLAADRLAAAHGGAEAPAADRFARRAVEVARAAAADQADVAGHAVGSDLHAQQHLARFAPTQRRAWI